MRTFETVRVVGALMSWRGEFISELLTQHMALLSDCALLCKLIISVESRDFKSS